MRLPVFRIPLEVEVPPLSPVVLLPDNPFGFLPGLVGYALACSSAAATWTSLRLSQVRMPTQPEQQADDRKCDRLSNETANICSPIVHLSRRRRGALMQFTSIGPRSVREQIGPRRTCAKPPNPVVYGRAPPKCGGGMRYGPAKRDVENPTDAISFHLSCETEQSASLPYFVARPSETRENPICILPQDFVRRRPLSSQAP